MHKESWIFKSDKIIISKIFDKVHNNLKSKLLFELVKNNKFCRIDRSACHEDVQESSKK